MLEHRDCVIEICLGVSERKKAGLVWRGREVDTMFETAPKEFFEKLQVLFHHIVNIDDVTIRKENTKHRANSVETVWHSFC